jgi:predicted nucleotidyltransferase component of viral defense system
MATRLGDLQTVEHFHLLFLAQLGTRLDKKLYALKGGCNLRFFWKSIRYSQDIDFDVQTIAKHTLQKNVRQILDAPGFKTILRGSKIQLTKLSEPKQTGTTQRWKVHLQADASGIDLPTKIEFSRRKFDLGVTFGPVDSEILVAHNLRPLIASHYDLEAAFAQKIGALLGRRETQARDIFDLAFLSGRGVKPANIKVENKRLAKACEIARSLPFDQFQGQVVAYLAPEYQEYYGNRRTWDSLQENLVRFLENL